MNGNEGTLADRIEEMAKLNSATTGLQFIAAVQKERQRQDARWGEQQAHSLHFWTNCLVGVMNKFVNEVAKLNCNLEAGNEVVFDDTIKELVQTAAVCQCIYEQYFAIRRKDSV